ncbi:MAG: class I SAM-dependent DNA methyltransferase, partial [Thiotrichaceae bacterium]
LDRAVFDAYGWNDLAPRLVGKAGATTPLVDKTDDQTQAEEELLTRLVALNAHRTEEEAQGHIRWLRPDFQAPHAQQVQTDLIIEGEGSIQPEASPAPTKLLTWPEKLNEKIQLVRQLLARNSQTLVALGKQFKNKPNDLDDVLMALCDLGHVTQTDETYQLI